MKALEIKQIKFVDIIHPRLAMRLETNKTNIESLAASIAALGLINPLTVVLKDKHYEVVAGFRRYLAIETLNWEYVPCIIITTDIKQNIAVMTAENYEREEINVFDESVYFVKLLDETKMTQKRLAKVINRSESYISERLSIVNYNIKLRDALYQNRISFSVARELNKITDESTLEQYVRYATENGCTPDIARRWRKELNERSNITAEEIAQEATEHYNEATNKMSVTMPCNICSENTDVNDLRTLHLCPNCYRAIKSSASI